MASDRRLALLIQAQVRGALDCREARPDDRWWWHKLTWTLDTLEDDNLLRILELRHRAVCAALARTPAGEGGAEQARVCLEKIDELTTMAADTLLPWLKRQNAQQRQRTVTQLGQQWKAIWGDSKDPEVARRIEETAQALFAMSQGARKGG